MLLSMIQMILASTPISKKLKIPAKRISEICGVSDITGSSTFKELKKFKEYIFPGSSSELVDGRVGDCRPPKKLETIYIAPSSAIPPTMRLIISSQKEWNTVPNGK